MFEFNKIFETKILPNVIIVKACWEFQGTLTKGYGEFSILGTKMYVHRASYIYHKGIFPESLHVLHNCDNPKCFNPDHLFLGTHQDNMRDKVLKGRCAMRLNEVQVLDIFLSLESAQDLAKTYDVSVVIINRIRRREQWQHITKSLELPNRYRKGHSLSLEDVATIYNSPMRICELSKSFEVDRQAIRKIKTKQSWKTYTDSLDKLPINV